MNIKKWIWFVIAVISAVIMTNCVLFAIVALFEMNWNTMVKLLSLSAASLTLLLLAFQKVKLTA